MTKDKIFKKSGEVRQSKKLAAWIRQNAETMVTATTHGHAIAATPWGRIKVSSWSGPSSGQRIEMLGHKVSDF